MNVDSGIIAVRSLPQLKEGCRKSGAVALTAKNPVAMMAPVARSDAR